MRLAELISHIRPARFSEKSAATLLGVSNGEDVTLPYIQAGWVNVADGQYTSGSPLVAATGTRTQLTIDGLGATTNRDYADGMSADVWSDNRFKPSAVGEAYNVRLTCTIEQTSSGTGHSVLFDADIGTDETPFVAAAQSIPLIKGQDVPMLTTIASPFFCLATFGLRGARFFITPTANIEIYNIAVFLQRTFKP